MVEFKVGDKVKCIETDDTFLSSDIEYTISSVSNCFVSLEGIPFAGFYQRRFEKIAEESKFTLGTKVWHNNHGWGEVASVATREHYCIFVRYNAGGGAYYDKDGKVDLSSKFPEIFLDEVKEDEWPKPKPKRPSASTLAMNQQIMVQISKESDKYTPRNFAFAQGENVFYWSEGDNSTNCSEKIIALKATDWRLPNE